MNSTNQASLIERLEGQLHGMQLAHKLITEFENSAIDYYAREVDLLQQRIVKIKAENSPISDVSGSSLSREEILKISTELTNCVPDEIHESDINDMEHIKANLKAAIILQLRKMNYR